MTAGRNLVFIGFMGAGKSTAARLVAEELGVPAVDADRVFEERHGPIEAFFDKHGEGEFRRREEALVLELLDRGDPAIALGGGAVESERVRAALAEHTVVLLEVDPHTAWHRAHGAGRPLARDRKAFEARMRERVALYEQVADVILPPADKGLAVRALPALRALPAGARMVWAITASGEYPVAVGPGVRRMPVGLDGQAYAVTDPNVRHWVEGEPIIVPPGERHKTLASAEHVWRELAARGATRADHVVGVGGGCVTDLAGFCAATYQRGVPVVQVPTSIVGQVDAAIGGKTAVDLDGLKNYVGAYHQPAAVLADTETLRTLPPAEHAAGYAEVVKTALIAGGALWERVASGAHVDERVIFACARTKVDVVGRDERDGGRRQVLNLGHTVAHAIELVSENRVAHGPAVAIGLLAALRLSDRDELRRHVAELLVAAGLDTTVRGLDPGAIVAATHHDKKRTSAYVPFVLVEAPGDVRHGQRVGDAELRAAVEELVAA